MACEERDSVLYVDAQIQGFLEKKPHGLLKSKLTKYWCTVLGSMFYMYHDKDQVTHSLDLSEAHLVRKLQSDSTGMQFEIQMSNKKRHCLVCPNTTNCTQWVKALQGAMMCKQSNAAVGKRSSSTKSTFFTPLSNGSEGIYDTFSEGNMTEPAVGGTKESISLTLPGRMKPESSNEVRLSTMYALSISQLEEGIYSKASDMVASVETDSEKYQCIGSVSKNPFLQADKSRSSSGSVGKNSDICSSTKRESSPKVSSFVSVHEEVTYSNDVSQKDNQEIYTDGASMMTKVCSSEVSTDENKSNKNISHGNAHQIDPSVTSQKEGINQENNGDVDVNDYDATDLFEKLAEALSEFDPVVHSFEHPLTEEDLQPVQDAKCFLSNNREICRVSYSSVNTNEDPVASLKLFLKTLNTKT